MMIFNGGLMDIHENVQWAIQQWNLKNTIAVYEKDNKAVYSSESVQWGNVILKVNIDTDELASEHNMLKDMDGRSSCRVFAYDGARGVLIEERIIPRNFGKSNIPFTLRDEDNVAVRVNHFLRVFKDIHKTIDDTNNQVTYLDWFKNADSYCMKHDMNELIKNNMHRACCIAEDLFGKYDDRVLLHGDLHHDNMMLNENGTYSMIDPKGVIGPEIFDLQRYILNEIFYVSNDNCKDHVLKVVEMISQKTKYPFIDIIKLFYMEVMLEKVWCLEDGGGPNLPQVLVAVELLNEYVEGA